MIALFSRIPVLFLVAALLAVGGLLWLGEKTDRLAPSAFPKQSPGTFSRIAFFGKFSL